MDRLRKLPPWLIVIPVALAMFYPLLTGDVLFWGLPSMQFVPWRSFAFDELRAGRLPLWNPYAGAGAPLLANYQTAVFYPPNWLHLLLPAPFALGLVGLLHLVWAAWGMWRFTGLLGVPAFGRTIGALAYPFSGYIIARLGTPPMVAATAWLPWLFWGVHRVMVRRTRRDAGILVLVVAMLLLAGHAQLAFYALLGAGLYALWLGFFCGALPHTPHGATGPVTPSESGGAAFGKGTAHTISGSRGPRPLVGVWGQRPRKETRATHLRALAMAAVAVALGAMVAAIQLLPTAELLSTSQRAAGLDDREFLLNFSYAPLRVLSQLTPHFFGTPADGSYQGKGAYWEDAAYVGVLPLFLGALAFFAWLRRRKQSDRHPALRYVPFFALMGTGAFVLAMGKFTPLYELLIDHVPTFDMFQGPARWMLLNVFALCVMAAIGTLGWGRGKWTFYGSRLAAAGGAGIVILALLAPNALPDNDAMEALVAASVALGSWLMGVAVLTLSQPDPAYRVTPRYWQAAVILFVALDVAWAGAALNPTAPGDYYDPVELDAVEAGAYGRAYWFEDYQEWVAFEQDDESAPGYFRFGDFRVASDNLETVRRSMLPNLNMLDGAALLNNFDPMQPGDHVDYVERIEALGPERAEALLRAAGVGVVYSDAGPPGWTEDEPGRWVAPEPAPRAWLAPAYLDLAEPATAEDTGSVGTVAEIIEDTPAELRLTVDARANAWLVLADTYYPGWQATVDGERVELHRANGTFRAVAVPPGVHEVTFSYRPAWLLPGVLITLAGSAVAVLLVARPAQGVRGKVATSAHRDSASGR